MPFWSNLNAGYPLRVDVVYGRSFLPTERNKERGLAPGQHIRYLGCVRTADLGQPTITNPNKFWASCKRVGTFSLQLVNSFKSAEYAIR